MRRATWRRSIRRNSPGNYPDGRYINLHRKFEPFDINLVPDKGIQFAELCSLTPVVNGMPPQYAMQADQSL